MIAEPYCEKNVPQLISFHLGCNDLLPLIVCNTLCTGKLLVQCYQMLLSRAATLIMVSSHHPLRVLPMSADQIESLHLLKW